MVLCGWLLHEKEHEVEGKNHLFKQWQNKEKKHDKNYNNQGFMEKSLLKLLFCGDSSIISKYSVLW